MKTYLRAVNDPLFANRTGSLEVVDREGYHYLSFPGIAGLYAFERSNLILVSSPDPEKSVLSEFSP